MNDISLLPAPIVAKRRGRGRTQLYIDVRRGVMTPPLPPRPGRKMSVWPAAEIDALNRAEIAGASDEELRVLVLDLVAQRAQGKPTSVAVP